MTGSPALLAGLGCAALLLVGGAILLLRSLEQADRVGHRVRIVTGGFRPASAPLAASLRRAEALDRGARLLRGLARLFGFTPGQANGQPAPLLVLPLALAAAIGALPITEALLGSLATPLIPLVWIVLCRNVFGYAQVRWLDRLYRQFPDALGTIIRAVRVGIPVAEAIRTVARDAPQPTATEFGQLADGLAIGMPLEEALREMAERGGLAEYRFFATALILQSQTGGGLTETLDNLADVIRRRIGLRMRAVALASEARTSALILAVLPVFTGLVLALINPDYIGQLFAPGGRVVLATAIVMLGCGLFVMRSLINRSLAL